MTYLLELRERISAFIREYDAIFRAAGKFLLAFAVFLTVISQISFLKPGQMPFLSFILALLCCFLPVSAVSILLGLTVVYFSFGISPEAGAAVTAFFILIILMYFVFKPQYSILISLAFLACTYNMGGAVPIGAALLCGPGGLVPLCIGVFYYDIVSTERVNYSMLVSYNEKMSSLEKITAFLQAVIQNRRTLMLLAAFILTFLIVWFIRRRAASYAWNIAIPAGVMVYILMIMAGSFMFDIPLSLAGMILGCVFGVLAALTEELFCFTLDGSRTEYLEYEDENYYYFVKAVPKLNVAAANRRVTRITGRRDRGAGNRETVSGNRPADGGDFWPQEPDETESGRTG